MSQYGRERLGLLNYVNRVFAHALAVSRVSGAEQACWPASVCPIAACIQVEHHSEHASKRENSSTFIHLFPSRLESSQLRNMCITFSAMMHEFISISIRHVLCKCAQTLQTMQAHAFTQLKPDTRTITQVAEQNPT